MRLLLLSALVLLVLSPAAADAKFKPPRSCRSGETIFRDGRVRLFTIEGTIAGEQAWRYFVCSARIRKPRRFNETSPGLDETLSHFRHNGRWLAFIDTYIGGESFDQALGRLDLRTGKARFRSLRRRDEGLSVFGIAVDESGGLAYLQETDGIPETIGYAPPRPDGTLAVPRPRATVQEGGVLPRSLAVAHGVITWRTRAGATGSVPTAPAPVP